MSTIIRRCLAIATCLITQASIAQQWSNINGLPAKEYSALEVIEGTLYTAAGNTLYTSSDKGATWTHSDFTDEDQARVRCFKKFNGRVYAGTSHGIFSAVLGAVHTPWQHDLQTQEVNSFAERDNVLYASMEVFGILKLNGTSAWVPFTTGIPNYSMSVTEILNTPDGLLAIAGANGTFYRYDFDGSTWVEDYYVNDGFLSGLDVEDIAAAGSSLYASRYNNIYRSDDLGNSWVEDKIGLMGGQNRWMFATAEDLYCISTIGTDTTRLHKRGINDIGGSWASNMELLPFFSFAMRELDGGLYLAAFGGVYTTAGILGTPEASIRSTVVFPNPSADGRFMIAGESPIESIKVCDLSGRAIMDQQGQNLTEFTLQQPGVYILTLEAGGSLATQRVIVR